MIFHYFIGFELLFHYDEFVSLFLSLRILLLHASRFASAELLVLPNMNFDYLKGDYFIHLFEEEVARFRLRPISFLLLLFGLRLREFNYFLADRQLEYLLNILLKLD